MAMQFVHLTTPESSVHVLCPVNSTPWACAIWQPWMDAYLKQRSPDRSCRAQKMGPQPFRAWADSSFLLSSSGCAGPWSLWPKIQPHHNICVLQLDAGRGEERSKDQTSCLLGGVPEAAIRHLFSHPTEQDLVIRPQLAAKAYGKCGLYFGWPCNLLKIMGYRL